MKLQAFIVCDDIRQETGNKVSLMGVYAQDYIISDPKITWPFPARLGFYVQLRLEANETAGKFEFHIMRNSETRIKLDGMVRVTNPNKTFHIHFVLPHFAIMEPGTLDFMIRFVDGPAPIDLKLGSLNFFQGKAETISAS